MRETLRAWDAAVLLGVAALGIVPLWCASWLPLMDMPQHLSVLSALSGYDQDPVRQAELVRNLAPNTNVLFHLLALPLVPALGVEGATRVVLTAGVLAWVGALGALAPALRLRPLGIALALPLVLNGALQSGYLNFWLAWPLTFASWAVVIGGTSTVRTVALSVLAMLTFLAHAEVWAFQLLLTPVLAGWSAPSNSRRAALWTMVGLAPSALYACAWLVPALSSEGVGDWRVSSLSDLDWNGPQEYLAPFWLRLFFITRGEPAEWLATLLWVGGIGFAARATWNARHLSCMLVPGVALLLSSVLLPEHTPNQYFIASRLVAPAFVCLALAVATHGGNAARLLGIGAFGLHVAAVVHAWRGTEREVAGMREVIALADPGTSMLAITADPDSQHVVHQVFLHAAAYHRVLNGGDSGFSFLIFESSPLRYREPNSPFHVRAGREQAAWCALVAGRAAAYDYYLLREGPDRCAVRSALDEQAAVVASEGDWTLYRAKAAISAWSPPGTCRCGDR